MSAESKGVETRADRNSRRAQIRFKMAYHAVRSRRRAGWPVAYQGPTRFGRAAIAAALTSQASGEGEP